MTGTPGIQWVPLFLELLIKSTLALSIALSAALLLRRKSASLRHFILAAFLVGLLIFPAFSLLNLGWQTDLLPVRNKLNIQQTITVPSKNLIRDPLSEIAAEIDLESSASDNAMSYSIGSTSPASLQDKPSSSVHRILQSSLVLAWGSGIFLLILRMGLGLFGASRMTREGKSVIDPAWRILMDRFLSILGMAKRIRLKSHSSVAVPLTWGLIRPVILIPSGHEKWSEDQKSSALLHELSHIKRADFFIIILVRISLALFWFNPLSWIIFRQMKSEQEKACDELVLKTGIKPSTYAANLLLFRGAAGLGWTPPAALLGIFGRSSFSERLSAILKQKLTFKEVTMKTKLLFGSIIILAVAFIGTAQPSEASPDMVVHEILSPTSVYSSVNISELSPAVDQEKVEAEEIQVQEEQEKQKEKQEEIKKIKKIDQHTIVISTGKKDEGPIEITITSGDKKEIFKVDGNITIKKLGEGKISILDADGKELKVIEGSPLRLSVKEGNVELIEEGDIAWTEGKAFLSGKEGSFVWTQKEGDKDKNIYFFSGKEGKAFRIEKEDAHGWTIKKDGDDKIVAFHAHPEKDAKVWVHKDEEGDKKIDIHIVPGKDAKVWTDKDKSFNIYLSPEKGDKVASWVYKHDSSEESAVKEDLNKLREELEKLKAEGANIEASLKSLEDLEKKLEDHKSTLIEHISTEKSPVSYTIIKKEKGDDTAKDVYLSMSNSRKAVGFFNEKGEAHVIYSISEGEKSRDVYEKTIARLKEELPEGIKLEPEFDEDEGVIKIKIISAEGQNFSKDLIKKITEIIEEETKK